MGGEVWFDSLIKGKSAFDGVTDERAEASKVSECVHIPVLVKAALIIFIDN